MLLHCSVMYDQTWNHTVNTNIQKYENTQYVKRPDSTVCPPHRQHLLVHTARTQGYSKLMLGDNCTRLAVKLLTSISLGRGAQLAQDTVRVCEIVYRIQQCIYESRRLFPVSSSDNISRVGVCFLTGFLRLQVRWHHISEANEGLLSQRNSLLQPSVQRAFSVHTKPGHSGKISQ